MNTIKKTIAWLVLLLTVAIPVSAEKLNKKAERMMLQDRYERKTFVVLRDGLAASYCGQYNPKGYGANRWFVLPLNEVISENRVSVDAVRPVGNNGIAAIFESLNCSGPEKVPVSIGDKLHVHIRAFP